MNRTQYWCDNCGRVVEDKRVPKSAQDFTSDTWEIWAPDGDVDLVFCSLLCLYTTVENIIMTQNVNEANASI